MANAIVFMTDWGLADVSVGVCHGVIAAIAPDACVIDLTHQVPRQDAVTGAATLGRAARFMPADSVYLAVVDPGVGTERLPVAVEAASGALLVGPDNGLLSIAWGELGGASRAVEISSEEVLHAPVSKTFHGRDIFSPAAAHLAAGMALDRLGPEIDPGTLEVLELPRPIVAPGKVAGIVTWIDAFGAVQLNVEPGDLEAAGLHGSLTSAGRRFPLVATFADVPEGEPAAIVDDEGYVSLVVNGGSAAELLGPSLGDGVVIEA